MHSRLWLGGGSAGDRQWNTGVQVAGLSEYFAGFGWVVDKFGGLYATCARVIRPVFHVVSGGLVSVGGGVIPGSHRPYGNDNKDTFILFSLFKSECSL